MNLSGVHVAAITPFLADGGLDEAGFRRHLDFLIGHGVQGLVPCGTTGESPTLSREERRRVLSICLEKVQGKQIEVIAGCGSNSTASVVELISEAEEMGCSASLVVTPYYNKPTPSGVLAHYLHIADRARKPVILYHVPGRTQVSIGLDILSRLFEHPQIAGIKEASGQYGYWLGLMQLARESGKAVLAGDDDAFAVLQAYGGTGIISASANVLPDQFVKLHRLMQAGEWTAAFDLQLRLAPLVRAFFSETNPGPIKFALSRFRGLENNLRLPLVPVNPDTEKALLSAWERFHSVGAST